MTADISLEYLSSLALRFALFIISLFRSTPRLRKRLKYPLPPGPTCFPIVGCLPQMMQNKPTFRWMHKFMQDLDTEIACFRLGRVHIITVTSPELAREFLKEHDTVFVTRPECMTGRITSDGYLGVVLSPGGDQWKKMRRVVVTEVLSARMHERLHAKRREEADHLVRYIYNGCLDGSKNRAVNVREAARLYCGCVTGNLMFGKRFFGEGEKDGGSGMEEREHMDAVWTVLLYTYGSAIADYVPFMEYFDLDGHKKILTDAIKTLRKYQDVEIDNRVEIWRKGVRNTKEDILDVLINLKDSNMEPLREINTLIIEISVAMIDNPQNIAEWAIAEMLNQPHTLELATKELDEVVGKDRLVQESDLYRLNYIKACAKEALRLHPVAPFNLPHVSVVDSVVGGYFIPKGSHVLISRVGLGRNPKVWEDPLKFKPERHIVDESTQVVLSDSELRMWTFSVGRRGCPAVTLGSTMSTILLARLVHGFRWALPPDMTSIDLAESYGGLSLAKP